MKKIRIALTFDTDADLYLDGKSDKVTWNGLDEIPAIMRELEHYSDSEGRVATATWFIRADGQLTELYGSPLWMFNEYRGVWKLAEQKGHELAWHPHCFRKSGLVWMPLDDEALVIAELGQTWRVIQTSEFSPQSIRLGWGISSRRIMETLSGFGLLVDSSAIPGWHDKELSLKDWRRTPNEPYYPSAANYRMPGADRLAILEIPMPTTETKIATDSGPKHRHINLSYHHAVLKEGIRSLVKELDYLTVITHCFELSNRIAVPNKLISFSYSEFRKNLDWILNCCAEAGRPFEFVTMRDVRRVMDGSRTA